MCPLPTFARTRGRVARRIGKFFRAANRFEFRRKMRHAPRRVNILEKTLNPASPCRHQRLSEPASPEPDTPKRKFPISGRCCAPHPPCIDLIDPPGHPLSGRAHFGYKNTSKERLVMDRWRILQKRTNFGIPTEINAVRFLCARPVEYCAPALAVE